MGGERWQRPRRTRRPEVRGAGRRKAPQSSFKLCGSNASILTHGALQPAPRERNVLTLVPRAAARIHLADRLALPAPASLRAGPGARGPGRRNPRAEQDAREARPGARRAPPLALAEQVQPPRPPRTRHGGCWGSFGLISAPRLEKRCRGRPRFLGKRGCSRLRKSWCSDDDLDGFIPRLALCF